MNLEKKLQDDLKNAIFLRNQARTDMEKASDRVAEQTYIINYLQSVLGQSGNGHAATGSLADIHSPLLRTAFTSGSGRQSAAKEIESILQEAGHAVRLKDIVKSAHRRGFGSDPKKIRANFASLLSKAIKTNGSIFKKEGRGLFALAN